MKNEFELAFNEIKNQRALPQDVVLEALQTALISAYRRYSGASAAQEIDASIDPASGRTRVYVEKEVVEEVQSPLTEVSIERARFYNPEAELFDMVMVQVEGTTKKFGRIAAQTAKQVILQKIREAERNTLYEEFKDREGDILSGTVQNVNNGTVTVSITGRTEAIMPHAHRIPRERLRQHDKIRVYVVEVKKQNRGPQIIVSRAHRNMLKRLLEFEVPEIYNGQVEIKSIAREPGFRSKVAVAALQEGVDPVGACVGMRGMRIQNIVRELNDEKIDVIEWQPDHKQFISRALSPARVNGVFLEDDIESGRTAVVLVPDDQLSLAIGREGQNARLAAKLTGWRIDIKSVTEAVDDALKAINKPPFAAIASKHPDLIEEAQRILAKREENRTVMPEEFRSLNNLANMVENAAAEARDQARQERLEEIEAVKSTVPEELFEVPVSQLDASQHITAKLESLGNVGEVMWRFLIDESLIRQMLRSLPDSAFESIKEALDDIMTAAIMGTLEVVTEPAEEAYDGEQQTAEATGDEVTESVTDESEAATVEETAEPAAVEPMADLPEPTADPDELPAAFPVDEDMVPQPTKQEEEPLPATPEDIELLEREEAQRRNRRQQEKQRDEVVAEQDLPLPEEQEYQEDQSSDKRGKRKKRQLIYDEEAGRVVSKRKRKGSRKRDEWEDYID